MRGIRLALLAGTVAVLCFAGTAAWSRLSPSPGFSVLENNRASRVIGRTVQDFNGEDVGVVKDFVVDVNSGDVEYGIVCSGGFLGIGARERAVPAQVLSTATAKRNIVALNISHARWAKAPLFDGDLAALSNGQRASQLQAFYKKHRSVESLAQQSTAPGAPAPPSPTGRQTGAPTRTRDAQRNLQFASTLLGKEVVNRQQQVVGQLSDLLIDLAGRKPVLALIAGGKLLPGGKSFAVPLRRLSLADRSQPLLDTDRRRLEQAPLLDAGAWQNGSRGIDSVYRYPDGESNNSRRNSLPRDAGSFPAFSEFVNQLEPAK